MKSFRLLAFVSALPLAVLASAQYAQTNLVSDGSVPAAVTDPNLQNPWGLAASATSPVWIADNVTNKSTVYTTTGALALTVDVPGGPTGIVANTAGGFSGSHFIFASLNGWIYGWGGGSSAGALFDQPGASFTGLAIMGSNIYATDQNSNSIDEYNSTTGFVQSFSDPSLNGTAYTPFGIQAVGSDLYVTYASAMSGGYVDEFAADGTMIRRFASQGPLDCPWGIALAPSSFGMYSNDLLIGNNDANGWILAYNPTTGAYLGTLDLDGKPISDNGLWGLEFGNGSGSGPTNTLYFTAGANDLNGLYGSINAAPEPSEVAVLSVGILGLLLRRRSRK